MLGERIKLARKAAGLTQEELADRCGTIKQTIYKYERGIVTNIPFERLTDIARALRVNSAYLMGWTDDPQPKETTPVKSAPPIPGFDELTDENKKVVQDYIDFLLTKQ